MSTDKVKQLKEIVRITKDLKKQGKIIVTTNGSYDIFHAGHARSLREAKMQGDVLVVGVNSDQSVKAYKSPDRPIIGEKERAEMVAALECVDYVFVFEETTPIRFINEIKPNIHANSEDYGENCIESGTVKKNGGKIYLLKKYPGVSTTEIIEKILKIYGK